MSSAEILPGDGLGMDLPLGALLYNIIKTLKETGRPFKIAYSSKNYLETPLLITLPEQGVRLMFSATGHQKLLLIEILNFEHLKLNYKGSYLNDIVYTEPTDLELASMSGSDSYLDFEKKKQILPPTLKEVYNRIFGPTFPGALDRESKSYLLSYPGVAFKFYIGLEELLMALGENDDKNSILSKLTNWHRASDIICKNMAIFNGDDYSSFLAQLPHMARDNDAPPRLSNTADLCIEKIVVTLCDGTAEIRFHSENKVPPAKIVIGQSTQQDILRVLGPPDAYFNKFDSRLLIHKHILSSTVLDLDSGSVFKFHNYFRHGIDLLYNLNPPNQKGGILLKIIIHNGGIIKTLDFMKWSKCNWKIQTRPGDAPSVNSSMYFHQFDESFLNEVNTGKSDPVLLNRNEIEFSKDDDLEVVLSDELQLNLILSATNLTESVESNALGQLKLYGYDRCIWEVVESNDCVSCVTIY